jgi:membrane fusion protein (multidrug efflux system)
MLHDENRASAFRQVMVSLVVVSLVVATAFAAWWYLSPRPAPPPVLRPITVAAQRAERLAWPSLLRGVGELEAVEGVDVASEVAGVIITIAFQPGQVVEKGDLIIQLDATIDRAQLAALKAQEKLAQLRFERQKALARRDIASTEALDAATAELQRLRAEIEAQEEAIEQKSIKAPFSGRLGIRQVSLGQYVQPGQPLVTLQNLDTLYVDFTLPEQVYSRVEAGQTITLHVAGYPEQRFAGTITAINPKIDPSTRNFTVQGTLANPDWRLQPGMFAAVTVQLGDTREVVVLPASAITYNPYGDAVFVLQPAPDPEHHAAGPSGGGGDGAQTVFVAHRIFVKTGEIRNDKVEIREGVQPDDLVVTAGQLKLRDNARVLIDDDAQAGGIPVASSRTR